MKGLWSRPETVTRRSLEVLACVCLLLIGCAHLGCGSESDELEDPKWSHPIAGVGGDRVPRPLGATVRTGAGLEQLRRFCDPPTGEDAQCEFENRFIPAELVSYECVGIEATIEVEASATPNQYVLLVTGLEPGICELHATLRDPATGEVYEAFGRVAFSNPERLAVEHLVSADPGLHHSVLVGAAFTVLPSVYGSVELSGTTELLYPVEDWEVELIGPAFECGCADRWVPCAVTIPEEGSLSYSFVVRAATVGTSTLIVRVGDLERVLTLEAVEESAVVDMELFRPVTMLGLIDADEDPLGRFEQVTEIVDRLPSGSADAELASVLVLGDGRRAWGGAGAYVSGDRNVISGSFANPNCPEAPFETNTWLKVYGTQEIQSTISAQLGAASVEFPVTVLPAQ